MTVPVVPSPMPLPIPSRPPDCGLVGCPASQHLQDIVNGKAHLRLPGPLGKMFGPPPPPPPPWWQHTWLYVLVAVVLLALGVAVAARRSPRVAVVVRQAEQVARRQARPEAVARWGGPLGRAVLAVGSAVWRFVQHGRGAKGRGLRALLVVLVLLSPVTASSLAVGLVAHLLGVPRGVLVLVAVGVLTLVVVASRSEGQERGWWTHRRLLTALIDAGVLSRPRADEAPPSLSYRGQPRHDEHGSSVAVMLPAGRTYRDVLARHEALAGALGVPVARLTVSQDRDDPAGVVRLHVGGGSVAVQAATVGTAERTRWAEPVRIGCDPQGRPVQLATDEANSLLAGQPGAGKTSVARIVLAHYLLDPTARVFLLDGKGSRRDYGDARPLCERFVSGTDDDAVEATEALLTEVLGIVRQRNADAAEQAPGGVLVLLEELQDVRAAADKATRERLDAVLGRVVRMGRAVGVSVLVSTQRPSVDDLPSGVRNLVSQRLALMLRNGADAALVLGTTPTLPLPTRRGEALLTTATGTVAVRLDHLTDAGWSQVCARAAVLRPEPVEREPERVEPDAPATLAKTPEPVAPRPEPAPLDPLVAAVVAVLADADPRGLPASALLERLPEWLAPATPADLGRALRGQDVLRRGYVGKAPVWRLAHALGAPLGATSASPRRALGPGGSVGSEGALHAHGSAAVVEPSEPSVVAP